MKFEDSPARVSAFNQWKSGREAWAGPEKLAREAMQLFEQLYELRGRIERESERLELVLGDGVLSWRQAEGSMFHPILLQRTQLRFNPEIPEFTIADSGRGIDLYSELFSSVEELDGRILAQCRNELTQGGYSPLGDADTSGFLRRLLIQLSAQGEFIADGPPKPDAETPQLGRDPVLLLRTRSLGFARALDGIIEELTTRTELPSSLLRIVGTEATSGVTGRNSEGRGAAPPEPLEVLLSKLANPEQEEIAKRLEQHGCVLVQGPPGTGKTHTIANLVGHLLAQGKSVLVTSHTTKALKVLRNQVVPELRPLCVSVLESDLESRKQLEGAVSAISERLASSDGTRLRAEAARFAKQRSQLHERLSRVREEMTQAVTDEYRDVVVSGESWTPSQAARKVSEEKMQHHWLPGPVMLGAALSLMEEEVRELYRTNIAMTALHEAELSRSLPPLSAILSPKGLDALLQKQRAMEANRIEHHAGFWSTAPNAEEPTDFDELATQCLTTMAPLGSTEEWKLSAIAAGMEGEAETDSWKALIEQVRRVRAEALSAHELLLQHAPENTAEMAFEEQQQVLADIQQHLENGGKLGTLTLLTHPSWKRVIRGSRVEAGEPRERIHFQALAATLGLKRLRQSLCGRWDRQLTPLGAPSSAELGASPEVTALQFCGEIERHLEWAVEAWAPLKETLDRCGLRWAELMNAEPVNLAPNGKLLRLRGALTETIVPALRSRARAVELARVRSNLQRALAKFDSWGGAAASSPIVRGLVKALGAQDAEAYARNFAALSEVHERQQMQAQRRALLKRLEAVAPGWADAIHERRGIHGLGVPPGDPAAAWCWRQLHDELERRGRVRIPLLQEQMEALSEELRRCTANLIERRSWAAQVERTTLQQQQALEGWSTTMRRIGKGTGTRAPKLRAEAARLMSECQGAVPVWIMPLAQVVENFNATTRFDVVIIDEASQCDAMALIALYMAERAVVVGDHEQVSPSAVGQNLGVVEKLIAEHLPGIPNAFLYDGRMSIYDLARSSFGGMVCLTEHFRCVPDIIEFSNQLSYEGRIRPLRESSSARVKPALLAHRVEGRAEDKVNRTEALTVASLVASAIAHPAYAGSTFGVISLVGDEQAFAVDEILREHLPPSEYESRRILCGNAAQFQGDERDVMFLSMVDSPRDGGPLSLRATTEFKQRFNVAVSRARDQLWLIHSLNPGIDLKPDDLRRRLIEHFANPGGIEQEIQEAQKKAESRFEHEVLARLIRAGYCVTSQWKVGHYRIDIVVEGNQRRLAVECDGDRFHPIEKIPEDMARQAILERLGWRFVRIRGSAFFRDPEAAMVPVFSRLKELGISPAGRQAEAQRTSLGDDSLRSHIVRHSEVLMRKWQEARSMTPAVPSNTYPPGIPPARAAHLVGRQDGGNEKVLQGVARTRSNPASTEKAETLSPLVSPPSADRLPTALREELSPSAFTCPGCGGRRKSWIGTKGPFLKCSEERCEKTETVGLEVLTVVLSRLKPRCTCEAPIQLMPGPSGLVMPYCSDDAACGKMWPWKMLREHLRREGSPTTSALDSPQTDAPRPSRARGNRRVTR
ncbi:AAA domain-containing protein [Myxococcus stipitatus]|uniref:AAA domain-containing protein n=1 Tax=Myxococcus stipitatus TaxID=83455 RepID=UPI0030CEF78C